jgi:hypothetical protein
MANNGAAANWLVKENTVKIHYGSITLSCGSCRNYKVIEM